MTKHEAHKYKKVTFKESGYVVFRCILPGCSHYVRPELLLGRLSICWICGNEHPITNINLAKQHCHGCTKPKRKLSARDAAKLEEAEKLLRNRASSGTSAQNEDLQAESPREATAEIEHAEQRLQRQERPTNE